MGIFFGDCGPHPLPLSRLWDEYTVSKPVFPRQWKRYLEFQGLPSSHVSMVFLVMLEHLGLSDKARTAELVCEMCLPPPPCLGLLFLVCK